MTAERSALEKAEERASQGLKVVGGFLLLFVGWKAYRALSQLTVSAPKVSSDVGPIVSSRDYTGPDGQKCHEETGVLGTKTECGSIPEPAAVKSAPRDQRLRFWIDHASDPKALLEALKEAGDDPPLERQVFIMAALHQASKAHLVETAGETWDDDDKAYQDVMVWWANARGDDSARAAAAARDWRALVGVAAFFCGLEPAIIYGAALGDRWTDKDCSELRAYAGG